MKRYRTIYGLDRDLASYLYGLEDVMSDARLLMGFVREAESALTPTPRRADLQKHTRTLLKKLEGKIDILSRLRKASGFNTPIAPRPLDSKPYVYKGAARYPVGKVTYRKKRR
jgi:hypothetical protein